MCLEMVVVEGLRSGAEVDHGISEATPEGAKRFKEARIKRGFVPPMEQCSYENED